MTTIRRQMNVPMDGNVVIPIGVSEAGTDIEVFITPLAPALTILNGTHSSLSREQWIEKFLKLEGSLADSNFCRPDQLPIDSIPSLN